MTPHQRRNTDAGYHIQSCATLYVTRNLQIKTMRYNYIPDRIAQIWNTGNTKCWWGCGVTGIVTHWRESRRHSRAGREFWWFLIKVHIPLPYDPAVMLSGTYPQELKTQVHTKTSTPTFIAAVFTMAQTWEEPRCPSVGEKRNQLGPIQTTEYYLPVKRNELSSSEKTWSILKCMSLSERTHPERAVYTVWF